MCLLWYIHPLLQSHPRHLDLQLEIKKIHKYNITAFQSILFLVVDNFKEYTSQGYSIRFTFVKDGNSRDWSCTELLPPFNDFLALF